MASPVCLEAVPAKRFLTTLGEAPKRWLRALSLMYSAESRESAAEGQPSVPLHPPMINMPRRRVALTGVCVCAPAIIGCGVLAQRAWSRPGFKGLSFHVMPGSRDTNRTDPPGRGPIFIVGSGHCGTTLLCRLIDAHPDICCGPESEAFVRNAKPSATVNSLKLTGAYAATANALDRPHERVSRAVAVERVLQSHCLAHKQSAKRWAEKTPTHVHHLVAILGAFPRARVVLMVRDGFDTICSFARRARAAPAWQRRREEKLLGLESSADVAFRSADRWVADNLAGIKYLDDTRVLLVRLEELVANPPGTLAQVLRHTGLSASADWTMRLLQRAASSHEASPLAAEDKHLRRRHQQIRRPVSRAILEGSRWRKCTADGNVTEPLRSLLECGPPHVLVPPRLPSRRDVALALTFELLMNRFGYDARRFCRDRLHGRQLSVSAARVKRPAASIKGRVAP